MATVSGLAGDRYPVVTNLYPLPPLGTGEGRPREVPGSPGGRGRASLAYEKMLRGELKALGVTQIMVGIVHFMFGVPLLLSLLSMTAIIGTPWWSGLLVGACLAMNIISAVSAVIAGFLYFTDLFLDSCPHLHFCLELSFEISTSLKVMLLIFDVLELVVALTVSTFSCRGLRCWMADSTMPAVVIHTIMHPAAYPISYPGSHSSVNPSYNPAFPLSEKIV